MTSAGNTTTRRIQSAADGNGSVYPATSTRTAYTVSLVTRPSRPIASSTQSPGRRGRFPATPATIAAAPLSPASAQTTGLATPATYPAASTAVQAAYAAVTARAETFRTYATSAQPARTLRKRLLSLEPDGAERRDAQPGGGGEPVPGHLLAVDDAEVADPGTAVHVGVGVEDLGPLARLGQPDPVVLVRHRGHVQRADQ